MRALADALPAYETRPEILGAGSGASLSGLFEWLAETHPGRLAIKDQTRRDLWCGRPQIEWTYSWALKMLERLSSYFVSLGLAPGSAVGVCLANSSESFLTILAIEKAGLTPCFLPLSWPDDVLAEAVSLTKLSVVVTQGVVGEDRPVDGFVRIQTRQFRLRHVMAFGPELPAGVTDLDRILMDPWFSGGSRVRAGRAERAGEGVITFSQRGKLTPLYRTTHSLVAAANELQASTRVAPGQRIVSLLAPSDFRGLTTGLVSALVSGASLECHGLFGAASLIESLEDFNPAHLVAPGWMENALAEFDLPEGVAPVLVHDAPVQFKPNSALGSRAVDVVALDEEALIASRRGTSGNFTLSFEGDRGAEQRAPLRTRLGPNDEIMIGGPSTEVSEMVGGVISTDAAPRWRSSGYHVARSDGAMTGVA